MSEYKIIIERDEVIIHERKASVDEIVEMLISAPAVTIETEVPEKKKRAGGGRDSKPPKKQGNKCGKCGEYGHNKKTCKFSGRNDSTAPVEPPKLSLTPDKLAKIKRMLGDGDSQSYIADECGVSEETVERIAGTLGL